MLNTRFLTLVGIVLAAAATRLLPHPPNFTPIGAMALFGGACFAGKRAAFLIPLLAMYLSDLALGFLVYDFGWFHVLMPYVYASFALSVALGLTIRNRQTPLNIGVSSQLDSGGPARMGLLC